MEIEDAFLHDILAHPDEDAPRLIYADWLDERNDPRGEFIRIQCILAQLGDEDPRRWPLEQREQELLHQHGAKWLPKNSGNIPCFFRRGFVEKIVLLLSDFPRVAGLLFEQAPIRQVSLLEPSFVSSSEQTRTDRELSKRIRDVIQSPYMAGLRCLHLGFPLGIDGLQRFLESPFMENLSELHLECTDLTLDAVRILANCSSLTNLTRLNLSGNRLTHEVVRILAQGRLLPQLETLCLDCNLLGDTGALMIRDWPALPRLMRLSLGHNHIFTAGVKALAEAPTLRELLY